MNVMLVKEEESTMLTKDLLRYKNQKDNLVPSFLKEDSKSARNIFNDVSDIYKNSLGRSQKDIESEILELSHKYLRNTKVLKAFVKLYEDKIEFEDGCYENLFETRKEIFKKSFYAIKDKKIDDFETYRALFQDYTRLDIYADHENNQKILKAPSYTFENLIKRYNVSLIQAIIIYANDMTIEIPKDETTRLRNIYRYLKFFRLIWEIEDKEDSIFLKITGPQSILKLSQKYGFSMACFLPSVFNLPRWRIKSEVTLKHKTYFLELDESSQLNSSYINFSHYVPEDLVLIQELLKKNFDDWSLSDNAKFLKLDSDYYIFPDFKFIHNKTKKALFLEVFHPWHKSQLLKRLKHLKKNESDSLIMLLNKKCLGKDFDKSLVDNLESVIAYTNIPNVKKLKDLIHKMSLI